MTKIKDIKHLKRMGIAMAVASIIFAVSWYIQGEPNWWYSFVIAGGVYSFVWLMAWVFRNNP